MLKSPTKIRIAFEDDRLLILDKPADIDSAPLPASEHLPSTQTLSMVDHAVSIAPNLPNPEGFERERGLLHRLDRQTSGLLVFAKTEATFRALKEDWSTKRVEKRYRALCTQRPRLDSVPFSIRVPLGASPKSSKRMVPVKSALDRRLVKALEAHTEILAITPSLLGKKTVYDVEIRIHTGVRHQIRCHLQAMKSPILGDALYKGDAFERLCLHAEGWTWHPSNGDEPVAARSVLPFPWSSLVTSSD